MTGARVRTLPLAFVPIILGSSSAVWRGDFDAVLAALALIVALALQIGVNSVSYTHLTLPTKRIV